MSAGKGSAVDPVTLDDGDEQMVDGSEDGEIIDKEGNKEVTNPESSDAITGTTLTDTMKSQNSYAAI